MMRSRDVNARASRTALIAASVPDETRRTFSTDGVANGVDRVRIGVTEEQRAPRHHPVDIAVAVDVLEVRTLAATDEERLVETDGAHRTHGRVHAAGDELERAAV